MDVTAAHVIDVPGLKIQQLTMEQAIIVMGFSGGHAAPLDLFWKDLEQRAPNHKFTITDIGASAGTRSLYREDFQRMTQAISSNPNRYFDQFYTRLYDLITEKMEGPFSVWDTRIDVIVACDIDKYAQEAINRELRIWHGATAEYTKRPGTTDQTWIVITRPDMTDICLASTTAYTNMLLRDEASKQDQFANLEVTIPISIPTRVEDAFVQGVGEGIENIEQIQLVRERFKKHQTVVRIIRSQAAG